MKRLVLFIVAVLVFTGCGKRIRIQAGMETTIHAAGSTLYSSIDPHNGEIFYHGPNPQLRTRAQITVDGQDIGSLGDNSWMPVKLSRFGRHTISALIYLKLNGKEEQVGCYREEFSVDPLNGRSSDTPGSFWRVVIYANQCY